MKKLPLIIIYILSFLCAGSIVLFIIVFVNTRMNTAHPVLQPGNNTSRPTSRIEMDDSAAIPERIDSSDFNKTDSFPNNDYSSLPAAVTQPPKYKINHTCGSRLDSEDMLLFLMKNNLFCKNSQWSKHWSNPGGKGIRLSNEGLFFTDSIVFDSITSIFWQRYSLFPSIKYAEIDDAVQYLNSCRWQGFSNWRAPTVEEVMLLLVPRRNRHGLYLPGNWNCNAKDIWTCSIACDSLYAQWMWVVRLAKGRCNYGHPEIRRALLAVRDNETTAP